VLCDSANDVPQFLNHQNQYLTTSVKAAQKGVALLWHSSSIPKSMVNGPRFFYPIG
jgi:hypothetical protein